MGQSSGSTGASNADELRWTELARETVLNARIFDIQRARFRSADGREAEFTFVHPPDWVNIIARLPNASGELCFLMVRQFRMGGGALSLEFPGGMVDPGEDPQTAAARELREETGYLGGTLSFLGAMNPNPAFMTNKVHTFLAGDLRREHDLDLDADEIVQPLLVPVADILAGRVAEFHVNGVMQIAMLWYRRHLGL